MKARATSDEPNSKASSPRSSLSFHLLSNSLTTSNLRRPSYCSLCSYSPRSLPSSSSSSLNYHSLLSSLPSPSQLSGSLQPPAPSLPTPKSSTTSTTPAISLASLLLSPSTTKLNTTPVGTLAFSWSSRGERIPEPGRGGRTVEA